MLSILKEKIIVTNRDTLYRFECPGIACAARPAQFVEVRITSGCDPFFRRPISIFGSDGTCIELLVRAAGKGTGMMCDWTVGYKADIVGPLGNSFEFGPSDRDLLLIGGGIGIAPLNFLARELLSKKRNVRLLFSPTRDSAILDALSDKALLNIEFASDRRMLPGAIEKAMSRRPDLVFACGPGGMMKMVADAGLRLGIPVQISMETRMACGLGLCLGCAIPIRTGSDFEYKKICYDGPVFKGEEIIFDEQS
jgi:dihydroorotate dehydrogenase electron transfer subunit